MPIALSRPLHDTAAPPALRLSPRGMVSAVFSFEMILLLFFYSNVFQYILPKMPVDSTILLLGLSIAVGGLVILREGIYVRGLILFVAFLPFLLWLFLSLAWTPSRIYAKPYVFRVAGLNGWCLLAGAMIIAPKRERMIRFLVLMVALSLVVALIGIYVYLVYGSFKFAQWENASFNWGRGGRVYNDWGRAVAYGGTILLLLSLRARFGSARQLLLGALLGICTFFLFIASSRSALLSLALPAMLFFAVSLAPAGRQGLALSPAPILLSVLLVMVVTAVGLAIASGHRVDTVGRFMSLLNQAENTELVMGANRFDYFAAALQFFFQSPLVGHGVRSFSLLYKNYEDAGAYAHNTVLEILGDTGLVGLLLFFLLFFVALRPVTFHRLRTDPLLLCVTMLFVGRVMVAMVGNELSYQHPLFLFLGFLALRRAPHDEASVEPGEETADEPAAPAPRHRPAAAGTG